MEPGKKKLISVVVIIVCITVAAVITFSRGSKSTGIKYLEGKQQWLKCTNEKCGAEYSMPAKEYYQWREKNYDAGTLQVPGMECKECGEESVFAAIKCEKCGHVFFGGASGADYTNRCPQCKYSKTEDMRTRPRN